MTNPSGDPFPLTLPIFSVGKTQLITVEDRDRSTGDRGRRRGRE